MKFIKLTSSYNNQDIFINAEMISAFSGNKKGGTTIWMAGDTAGEEIEVEENECTVMGKIKDAGGEII